MQFAFIASNFIQLYDVAIQTFAKYDPENVLHFIQHPYNWRVNIKQSNHSTNSTIFLLDCMEVKNGLKLNSLHVNDFRLKIFLCFFLKCLMLIRTKVSM